ncbi:MAG: amidophosphoribosyltransferase [Clostridiales bacterium]|jgi:amidophosphoribosyltransferase|nr:amidophosphoribosyltransferase [Clostridiales bacterium]
MNSFDKLNEECAIFGISGETEEAAGITYNGLLSLQHRGQEGAGIAALSGNTIHCYKNRGLVSEVFSGRILDKLPKSGLAVGHTRYSTTGTNSVDNVQPFVTEYLTGRIATAHNGNVINARQIREKLLKLGLKFSATSDSEIISSLVAYYTVESKDILKGVVRAARELVGAFSIIIITGDNKLIAIRDSLGFRPLCIGRNDKGMAFASESCALDGCGFEFVRDVLPGEIVVIENGKIIYEHVDLTDKNVPGGGLCIFEYVYFARPDSVIDNLAVSAARQNMGGMLAVEHPVEADIVCGVPDSGTEAAFGYSAASGIPLATGFVKNRYIGRSFIYPVQSERESAVRLKLNPVRSIVEGKRVILVDDSIVRGTTSARIVRAMRQAGAREVHMRVSSPPFKFACHYGTDIDSTENLIANKMSIDQIRQKIDVDSLGYISIKSLKTACSASNMEFCVKCFAGGNEADGILKDNLEAKEGCQGIEAD